MAKEHPCLYVGRDKRPWNKGLLIGQKKPLEPKHVWSIRVRLEIGRSWRDLVIFNLAIDSKLRAVDDAPNIAEQIDPYLPTTGVKPVVAQRQKRSLRNCSLCKLSPRHMTSANSPVAERNYSSSRNIGPPLAPQRV